jgi:hypothetical protein
MGLPSYFDVLKPTDMKPIKTSSLWIISAILSSIAILIIANRWSISNTEKEVHDKKGSAVTIVHNQNELDAYFNTWQGRNQNKPNLAHKIPTGFFIQSIAFQSPNEVNITGIIWQRIPFSFPDSIPMGFDFPEQVNSGSTVIKELYNYDQTDSKLKGWYFDTTVRQVFDYTKYPFDYITAWLRVWPSDFNSDADILFVPDFKSYDLAQPIYGLDSDIVYGEWNITETFFSYHENKYNTNFGYTEYPVDDTYNEFYINLGLKRDIVDAIILNLIPLFVVALLLFAQMMTVTNNKDLNTKFGFNTSGAIATCSALFFIVLLAHIQVRQQFLDSPLVYIEYFYLIMYILILLCALNFYVFSVGTENGSNLILYRDNLIPKVVFWPLLLWMIAVATVFFL